MFIVGLWHGASWKCAIWGGLNGLGIVVYKFWRKVSPYENSNQWYVRWWKILVTLIFITFTRIYFRGESMDHIARWYKQVAYHMDWHYALDILAHYHMVFWVMLLGYITHWLPESTKTKIEDLYANSPAFAKVIIAASVGVICYQAFSTDFQPFIYFQF